MLTTIHACRLGLLALLLPAVCTFAQAKPPPPAIENFFSNAAFNSALLSPNARLLAVRIGSGGGRERLTVVDLATNAIKVIAQFSDLDIGNFEWINDERLVFDSFDKNAAQGDVRYAPWLYAVNRDGSGFRQLANINSSMFQSERGARLLPSDRRVPLYYGEKFYAAVKKTNPNVEWVVYNEEGHGWALPKNRIDFWSRVEKFLARHIGTP